MIIIVDINLKMWLRMRKSIFYVYRQGHLFVFGTACDLIELGHARDGNDVPVMSRDRFIQS